jgi:hypothetical protein
MYTRYLEDEMIRGRNTAKNEFDISHIINFCYRFRILFLTMLSIGVVADSLMHQGNSKQRFQLQSIIEV